MLAKVGGIRCALPLQHTQQLRWSAAECEKAAETVKARHDQHVGVTMVGVQLKKSAVVWDRACTRKPEGDPGCAEAECAQSNALQTGAAAGILHADVPAHGGAGGIIVNAAMIEDCPELGIAPRGREPQLSPIIGGRRDNAENRGLTQYESSFRSGSGSMPRPSAMRLM